MSNANEEARTELHAFGDRFVSAASVQDQVLVGSTHHVYVRLAIQSHMGLHG